MRKTILAAVLLAGTALTAMPAQALEINILTNAVPQSQSNPCIICATMVQQPTGFGFNNFVSTGNDDSFNLFSSAVTGTFGNNVMGTPYSAGFLANFLTNNLNDPLLEFGVVIDINSAATPNNGKTPETLTAFQLINLDGAGGNPEVLFNFTGALQLPEIRNGNGFGDYIITGFNLTGIDAGDRLIFRAAWDHATDGGESFYITASPAAVPGPIVGAGIPGLMAACFGMFGLRTWRRRRNGDTLPA